MFRRLLLAFVLATVPGFVVPAFAADEATQELTLRLTQISAPEAATLLKTIVATKGITGVDDRTLVIRDTEERLALAREVVGMADTNDAAPIRSRLAVSDGTVITGVTLEHAFAEDVMVALREQLHIARIVTLGEKRLFLRDTESQTAAALKVINDLDTPGSH